MKKQEKRPDTRAGTSPETGPEQKTRPEEKKKSILVIEDCQTDMTFIRIVLRHLGFNAIEISHSSKFFDTMWRNAEDIFMILMDGHVPDFNPDSSIILPYITRFYEHTPEMLPILVSTTTDKAVKEKHLKNGCSYHIEKENIVDDLTNLINFLSGSKKDPIRPD